MARRKDAMIDPKAEYQSRLAEWSKRAEAQERAHVRMGNLRLLFVVGLVVAAAFLVQTRVGVGITISMVLFGLFLTGMVHDRILKARDMARRAMGDPAAAIRAFEEALATPPPASVAWGLEEQLALLYAAQGDAGRARQYAQDALHKAPEKDKAPLEARLRAAALL